MFSISGYQTFLEPQEALIFLLLLEKVVEVFILIPMLYAQNTHVEHNWGYGMTFNNEKGVILLQSLHSHRLGGMFSGTFRHLDQKLAKRRIFIFILRKVC